MIDPDWGDPKQIQNAKQEYPILSDATALLNALDHAMQTNDLPAAVGLLRVIDTTNATDKDKQVYLRGTGIALRWCGLRRRLSQGSAMKLP